MSPPIPVFGHRPAGGGQPEGLRLAVKLPPQHAALGPCDASAGVDTDPLHRRQVNDQAAIVGPVTGGAMAPAAHRHQQALRAREADCLPHISNPTAARHQRGTPVDVAVPDPPGGVVTGIGGADQLTPEHLAQAAHRFGAHRPDRISLLRTDCSHVRSFASPALRGGLTTKAIPCRLHASRSFPGASHAGWLKRWKLATADLHTPHPPVS